MNLLRRDNFRILVTNDDGIHAPGLQSMLHIAKQLSDDVWVVAPEVEQSAKSHALTIYRPLRKTKLEPKHYTINGTPTDCVVMAIHQIMDDKKPDLVLSGVNRGANLAEDVHYSGTVAAATEAALLGVHSIACSLGCLTLKDAHWETTEHYLPQVISRLIDQEWVAGTLINVNVPNIDIKSVQGMKIVAQGQRKYGYSIKYAEDPRGQYYYWISSYPNDESEHPNTDLTAVAEGYIAVTPLKVDVTATQTLKRLQQNMRLDFA